MVYFPVVRRDTAAWKLAEKEGVTLSDILRETYSVCPKCGDRLKAAIVREPDNSVHIRKSCPDHGKFSALIWKGHYDLSEWYGDTEPIAGHKVNCPSCAEMGLCADHINDTCCVVYEVTDRCDMNCKYCFADAGSGEDKTLDDIRRDMEAFVRPGRTLVQLSGGEPTLRDDLPDIVKVASELGCSYVQLNSNGVRLAEDAEYVKKLADAGLSFVFMQFDGTDDDIYMKLRGRPMFDIKSRAIENCARFNLGVTLVPTVVPGVNTDSIGDIIRFGVSKSPAVRGIHFQPVAYLGRIPEAPADSERCTLDDLLYMIESQTEGLVKAENLQPSKCDHPLCGFHGDFIVQADATLFPLTLKREDASSCCCGSESPADKNREFVGRRWKREEPEEESCCCTPEPDVESETCCCASEAESESPCCPSEPEEEECCCAPAAAEMPEGIACCGPDLGEPGDMTDMDYFLSRVKKYGFTITSMAFQDSVNFDIERLRHCSLHVYEDGRLAPFCANYFTLMEDAPAR